jgi:hypothetical protein
MGKPTPATTTHDQSEGRGMGGGHMGKKIGGETVGISGEQSLKQSGAQTSNDLSPVGKDTWCNRINDVKDVEPGDTFPRLITRRPQVSFFGRLQMVSDISKPSSQTPGTLRWRNSRSRLSGSCRANMTEAKRPPDQGRSQRNGECPSRTGRKVKKERLDGFAADRGS